MNQDKFFQGLRVLELSNALAGPSVGMFFAELGAEVLKVENPKTGGDITRAWQLPKEKEMIPPSGYYCCVNWGKKVIFRDLTDPSTRPEIEGLIRESDILISNFKETSAKKLQLDYDHVRSLNEQLIYAHITGMGEESTVPAFDMVLQAEAGYLGMCGTPEGELAKIPLPLIDVLAGHQIKEGVLMALLRRERTGKGGFVAVSLLEAAVSALTNQGTNWLIGEHIPAPMGTLHPNIAPYGDLFEGADGRKLVLAVGTEKHFHRLCEALGHPEWITDPRFADNNVRVTHRKALDDLLAPVFRTRPVDEWVELLGRRGVPVGKVRNMQEVFHHPLARKMVLKGTFDDQKEAEVVRTVAFHLE